MSRVIVGIVQVNATAKHGCTALYYAAYNGHALAVKSLLANGAEKSLGDEKVRHTHLHTYTCTQEEQEIGE
jgi:ankyrin repeat protein